jgi:ribosomal-protein-alanine N-acetyltransferase
MKPRHILRQMDDADANEVARWRHDPPYDFYDSTADPADPAELLDQERRGGVYFSVLDGENRLAGFFQFEKFEKFERKDGTVEVGLGLGPDLTGKGPGAGFVLSGRAFARAARARFSPQRFTPSGTTFDERAIGAYERVGFRRGAVYTRETDGGEEYGFLPTWREA